MSSYYISFLAAERPRIKCQPQNWNYAFAKERVLLTIQATGSEPLQYYWEWRPPGEGHGWHALSYDINKTHGTDTPTLVISNVQKSDEGSYQCTVSNCAGSETSQSAILEISVGEYIAECHTEESSHAHITRYRIKRATTPQVQSQLLNEIRELDFNRLSMTELEDRLGTSCTMTAAELQMIGKTKSPLSIPWLILCTWGVCMNNCKRGYCQLLGRVCFGWL